MKLSFDHIHLNSGDSKAAADFYIEKFGGKKTAEREIAGTPLIVVEFDSVRLLINEKAPTGPPAGSGVDHIGFRTPDLDAAAAELKEKGADFMLEPVEMGPDMKIALVTGPDNVMIELSEER